MKAKKTLALLIFKYFPYGGLQRDFLEVAKNILKRDVDIKILTGSWEGPIPLSYTHLTLPTKDKV